MSRCPWRRRSSSATSKGNCCASSRRPAKVVAPIPNPRAFSPRSRNSGTAAKRVKLPQFPFVAPVSDKAKPLSDEFRFLRGAITRPRAVGAIAPSSPALARAIAAQIDPELPGPILELGPGTGVVTEAVIARGISEERLIAIEFDADFAGLIASRYPQAHVIAGDAFDLDGT